MILTSLSIANLRKIKVAQFSFVGKSLVKIKGPNGAGKSTVIDAIQFLLNGRTAPPNAVTKGEEDSTIVGMIDDYCCKRVIKPDGKTVLKVTKNNVAITSPQSFLDSISGTLIDPQSFCEKTPAEKRSYLLEVFAIDTTEIDQIIKDLEQDRLFTGRDLKRCGEPIECPKVERKDPGTILEKIKQLQTELAEIESHNDQARKYETYLKAKEDRDVLSEAYKSITTNIEDKKRDKMELLKNIDGPDGLEITEDNVLFRGISSENWSTAEGLKLAMMLIKPGADKLNACYIKRGESFDRENLEKIARFCEQRGIQVFLEVVSNDESSNDEDGSIYLEEGEIKL